VRGFDAPLRHADAAFLVQPDPTVKAAPPSDANLLAPRPPTTEYDNEIYDLDGLISAFLFLQHPALRWTTSCANFLSLTSPPGSTMEAPPQRRDINELLTTGYFKTARGKSPSGLVIASLSWNLANVCFAEPPLRATRPRSSQPLTMFHANAVEADKEALADDFLHLRALSWKTS